MINKIIDFLDFFERRPSMILSQSKSLQSASYILFFEGFLNSLELTTEIKVQTELSQWYQDKVELKAPNMTWSAHFQLVNKGVEDSQKIESLFNTLKSFFIEKKNLFE